MAMLEQTLAALRAHRAELNARGVLHAAVFGSVARGEERPDSDVDILVDLAPEATATMRAYFRIEERLHDILGRKVDVVNRKTLKTLIRPVVEREAVDAF